MVRIRKLLDIDPWLAAVLAVGLLSLALTNQSIDLEESQTWDYARVDNIGDFWRELGADPNSESRMPAGMLAWWGWSRVLGTGELAMRALNLVWAVVAIAAFALIGRRLRMAWLPLLFAAQPYAWYSMNLARTPFMQIAGGSLLALGMVRCLSGRKTDLPGLWLLGAGALLLFGASIFGLVPLAAVAIVLAVHWAWLRFELEPRERRMVYIFLIILGLLATYYASTLLRGWRGSGLWAVTLANPLYVFYEFMGFQGLGPGRQELREIIRGVVPKSTVQPFLPGLVALALAYGMLGMAAFKAWMTRPFERISGSPSYLLAWVAGLGVVALSLCFLFFLALLAGFHFWGRDLAGAFPFWILTLALTMRWACQGLWRAAGRLAVLSVVGLLIISSVFLRGLPYHRHDDYRAAAAEAKRLAGLGASVWWVADPSGGSYYGLPAVGESQDGPGAVVLAFNRTEPPARIPDAIIISRRENFDRLEVAAGLIRSGKFRLIAKFQAFEVWVSGSVP